jgi:hypothetical protein
MLEQVFLYSERVQQYSTILLTNSHLKFITYFPWYQCDNTRDKFLSSHCVFLRHTFQRIKSIKTGMGWQICDKKNLPCFVMWYDFYPTHCMFSPRLGDRKHTTSLDNKIISHHKPWEILYILYFNGKTKTTFIKSNNNLYMYLNQKSTTLNIY